MSRRRRAEKREVLPDPKFGDLVVTKFMNYVMYEGKKAVAENIVYGAFDILEQKRRESNALETFRGVIAEMERLDDQFPPGLKWQLAFDNVSVVRESIIEVLKTLAEEAGCSAVRLRPPADDWNADLKMRREAGGMRPE